jgi:threonylcarbamoyladenosine tRNA methylthiotransferase MtaB
VRGRERSVPLEQVVDEVRQRVAHGVKEVVLTGTEIGTYNYQGGINLEGLLEHILADTNVERVRLSSLQPQEISTDFIHLWHDSRLCPHFHLSLQSGSDGVLARMKRRYVTGDYRHTIALIRRMVPETAITTDIIVGFPGETEAEFKESFDLCRQMDFARIHVFPYSPRRGTEAAQMPEQVGVEIKRQRSERMLALATESAQRFSERFLNRTMSVLWEKQTGGIWSGYTGNYIRVHTRNHRDLTNQLLPVRIKEVRRDGVWGSV